jgi:hypothetical protein
MSDENENTEEAPDSEESTTPGEDVPEAPEDFGHGPESSEEVDAQLDEASDE